MLASVVGRKVGLWVVGVGAALLVGCASQGMGRAPVEDRGSSTLRPQKSASHLASLAMPPGFENAGKPGYYTVKPGDTVIRIALEHGQSVKDLALWNNLGDPNRIEIGQVVRIEPPVVEATGAVVQPVRIDNAVAAKSLPSQAQSAANPTAAAEALPPPPPPADTPAAEGGPVWAWPAVGTVIATFDEAKNKGIDIAGVEGAPVLAASDGRVVYVGSDLRGYGKLIILKHNNIFLTAYAHNQELLVSEDQVVTKGQKIATMGSSDTNRVKLHFEIRRQGKPVDPMAYLPPTP